MLPSGIHCSLWDILRMFCALRKPKDFRVLDLFRLLIINCWLSLFSWVDFLMSFLGLCDCPFLGEGRPPVEASHAGQGPTLG